MKSFSLRQPILLLIAIGAGSFLVAGSAQAELALFRAQHTWRSFPNPADTPGNAGFYQGYVEPYLTKTMKGGSTYYIYPPGTATVTADNNVGAPFTLPTKAFHSLQGTYDITPKTGWPGYTTYSYLDYYNGPVRMRPQNTHTNTDPVRVVFPTTGNNPYPNYAKGQPVTPTTTFGGIYDFQRVGEIRVNPGPRQFGGTYRYFHGPNNSTFYQFIDKFSPTIYKAYGAYNCFNDNLPITQRWGCTKDNFVSKVGDVQIIYTFTRFLLNVKGTGTGDGLQSSTAKATTVTGLGGYPTVNGGGTPNGAPASYVTGMQRYLDFVHPWTTGYASASNPVGSPHVITPMDQGYDTDLFGAEKVTVTRSNRVQVWNKTAELFYTTTMTAKSYLYGVGRVVSLVRPKLIHTYTVPFDPGEPIWLSWPVARMWTLKVWFLPEPTGMLLLGSGIAGLLVLSRMRRR